MSKKDVASYLLNELEEKLKTVESCSEPSENSLIEECFEKICKTGGISLIGLSSKEDRSRRLMVFSDGRSILETTEFIKWRVTAAVKRYEINDAKKTEEILRDILSETTIQRERLERYEEKYKHIHQKVLQNIPKETEDREQK